MTLAYVEKHIINTLITICAQPTSIQGVRLIESVIHPDCLRFPSRAQDREDQCMQITYLKQQLREKLERGEPECYDWKCITHTPCLETNYDLIELLGFENYWGVVISCKAWLELVSGDGLLKNDEDNLLEQPQNHPNLTITSLKSNLVQERQILEEAIEVQCSKFMVKVESEDAIEVQSSQFMGKAISNLQKKKDATNNEISREDKRVSEINEKLGEIHENFQCVRKDVMTKIKKSLGKLLKLPMENEDEKQLPRVAILTTKFLESTFEELLRWVPRTMGGKIIRIQLYCEDKQLPHPVENQPGITLTSFSESYSECLENAIPYINGLFHILTTAARVGISSMVPLGSSLIPNWTPHLKLANQYPMVQSHFKSKKDIFLSKLEYASKEWQKCLALILEENGGLSDENISKKFLLKCANYEVDGRTQVAWLCETHYKEKGPFH